MTVRPILRWPDPRLGQRCEAVDAGSEDVAGLVDDLFHTMYAASGRGLAAPQIGVMARVFVMDTGWKEGNSRPLALVNPAIDMISEDMEAGSEQCLSIPGLSVEVMRTKLVIMSFDSVSGEGRVQTTFAGVDARCALHECDHLDGVVTLDHLEHSARAALLAQYEGAQ